MNSNQRESHSSTDVNWTLPAEQSAEASGGEAASEPRLERLQLRITDDLLVAAGDPQAIASIHNRQSLSNDLQRITRNVFAGLFVIAGAIIIVFGPQNKYSTVIMGVALIVIAAGSISGFTTLSLKAFGIRLNLTAGQSEPNATTRTQQRVILWVLLGVVIGVVIGGGAVYALLVWMMHRQ